MSDVRRKILIDTDAGVDDAQAILLALKNPDVDVIGITCVMGNADVKQVGLNVLRILKVVDRMDIPVFIGCNEPLLGDKKPPSDYHGSDGFGDAPDPAAPDDSYLHEEHAVTALVRLSKEYKGELTLVCIGPLTNIAMAIRMDSHVGSRIKDCYIMGGNHEGKGNMTTSAEFNFYCDPEAAYVVLNQLKSPITMVTWETCEKHSLPWEWYKQFFARCEASESTSCGLFLSKLEKNIIANFYQTLFDKGIPKQYEVVDQYAMVAAIFDDVILKELYRKLRSGDCAITNFLTKIEKLSAEYSIAQKWETFIPCDEVLVACCMYNDVIKTCCDVYATVEIKGQYTWGQMVVDWKSTLKKATNVNLVTEIDQSLYVSLLRKLVDNIVS